MSKTVTTGNKKTVKCTEAVMKKCKYGRCLSGGQCYCNYLEMMNERRGCSPKECDKYVESKPKKYVFA